MKTSFVFVTACAVCLTLVTTGRADLIINSGTVNDFPPMSEPGAVNVRNGADSSITTVNVRDGGFIGGSLSGLDNSRINISGGQIGSRVIAYDNSVLTISGGRVESRLDAFNNSIVNISGGIIGSRVGGFDYSVINISGGSIGSRVDAQDNSLITISGGYIDGSLGAFDDALVMVSGGQIGDRLIAFPSNGTIVLFGDFNFEWGEYPNLSALDGTFLTGTLADGTTFNNAVVIGRDSKVILAPPQQQEIPEPASVLAWLLMACVAAVSWYHFRRARKA